MGSLRLCAAVAALSCVSAVEARDVSRYKVTELAAPASVQAGCLPNYSSGASIGRINDFGMATASFNCYSIVDPTTPSLIQQGGAIVTAPWFGGVELARTSPGYTFANSINNRGELFGFESPTDTPGLFATRWTVSGGIERIFFDPDCDGIQVAFAVDGNGRNTIGWAFRKDPSLGSPYDFLCLISRWTIRDSAGVETVLPINGTPSGINDFDIAVGLQDRSAVRYNVRTGQLRVLHAQTSAQSLEVSQINNLGDVVGRITRNSTPDVWSGCDPGVGVHWDRDGRERLLPHLPGAVSSRAYGVGDNGVIVGDSGAGHYCSYTDNSSERAVLWDGGRVYDVNTLIPRGSGITLTYAYSVNRRGQITAGGFVNGEALTQCPSYQFDSQNGTATIVTVPCHNTHMFLLTPVGR